MTGSRLEAILLGAQRSPDGLVRYVPDAGGVQAQTTGDARAVLTWAFGAGVQGMTAVGSFQWPANENALEHRYSAYTKPRSLAVTFGHPLQASTPMARLGVLQDKRTIARCFGCHSTAGSEEVQDAAAFVPIEAGVQCERCHGPGAAHIAAAHSERPVAEIRNALFNPGRLPARAQVEVCGACHRLPESDSGDEPELADPVTVRFAPVGLMASRCFRESKALSCLTCHNPHANVLRGSDASYRDKCLTCHTSLQNVRLCRRAQKGDCVSCHMRKASLTRYLAFTDHRIRVYPSESPANRRPAGE